jgi:hypothetical protein
MLQIINAGGHIKDNVRLLTAEESSINYASEGLDPGKYGDRLVAGVISYQREHALEYVVLITDDASIRLKAIPAGIELSELPEPLRLAPPKSSTGARLGAAAFEDPDRSPTPLRSLSDTATAMPQAAGPAKFESPPFPDVAQPASPTAGFGKTAAPTALKQDEPLPAKEAVPPVPRLHLGFDEGHTHYKMALQAPRAPSDGEISRELARLKEMYPRLSENTPKAGRIDAGELQGDGAPGLNITQRRVERNARYNHALVTFYTDQEAYLRRLAEFQNLQKRIVRLDISLFNDRLTTVRSIYIALHFPARARVYDEDTLPELPPGPQPPEKPDLTAAFDAIRLPSVPVPSELLQGGRITLRNRSLSPLEIKWNNGWDVFFSIRELEPQVSLTFNPLFIVFNSYEEAGSLRLPYRITIASLSQEERGALDLIIEKAPVAADTVPTR